MPSAPPELSGEDRLDGLESFAAFKGQLRHGIREETIGGMLCQLRLAPVFVALPIAFAEEHSDGAIATIGSCDDHTLIFPLETRDIEAKQVDQAFDQVDLAVHRFSAALRAFDAVAEG